MPSPAALTRLSDVARVLKLTKQTGRSFHVAFVLKGRKVISLGVNDFRKTNRVCATYKPTRHHLADYRACVHGEISATSQFRGKDVRRLTLVSIRIDNHNRLAYAEPCPNCAYHLGQMGFRDIWFSGRDGGFRRMV